MSPKRNSRKSDRIFSDIVDDEGYQYVDLVLEGGGVLGYALLGYINELEKEGIRFLNIGGTSAGSIIALGLAAAGKPNERKALKLHSALKNMPLNEFLDGSHHAKKLAHIYTQDWSKRRFVYHLALSYLKAKKSLGFHPGNRFQEWLVEMLGAFDIKTTQDLLDRMHDLPELKDRSGKAFTSLMDFPLCLTCADISTHTRVRFPEMAPLYWKDNWQEVNPAEFVRASMAVPFMFEPFIRKRDVMSQDKELWKEKAGFSDNQLIQDPFLPDRSVLLDGGVMSNFPIDVFTDYQKTHIQRPTFGVKLSFEKRIYDVPNIFHKGFQMFNAASHIMDVEFIRKNPHFAQVVTHIDTGNYYWLNFDMKKEDMQNLFHHGSAAARNFLDGFNWEEYRDARNNVNKSFFDMLRLKPRG